MEEKTRHWGQINSCHHGRCISFTASECRMSACCCQYDLETFNSNMLCCTIYQPAWLLAALVGDCTLGVHTDFRYTSRTRAFPTAWISLNIEFSFKGKLHMPSIHTEYSMHHLIKWQNSYSNPALKTAMSRHSAVQKSEYYSLFLFGLPLISLIEST